MIHDCCINGKKKKKKPYLWVGLLILYIWIDHLIDSIHGQLHQLDLNTRVPNLLGTVLSYIYWSSSQNIASIRGTSMTIYC